MEDFLKHIASKSLCSFNFYIGIDDQNHPVGLSSHKLEGPSTLWITTHNGWFYDF